MHVTTKETDQNGVHILTSVLEADGASELVSEKGKIEAQVISISRSISGGIQVQTSVKVTEPEPEQPKAEPVIPVPTAEEQAQSYMESKGLSAEEAKAALDKFGAQNILLKRQSELDQELNALLAK